MLTDAQIAEAVRRCEAAMRHRFASSRHLIDWEEVRLQAGLFLALYVADITPTRPTHCQSDTCNKPLPQTGHVKKFCSNTCRSRQGDRDRKRVMVNGKREAVRLRHNSGVQNQSAGLARRCSAEDRPRFVQQALNSDICNWIATQLKRRVPMVPLDQADYWTDLPARPRPAAKYVGDAIA